MRKRLFFTLLALVAVNSLWAKPFTLVAPDGNSYEYTVLSDTEPRTVAWKLYQRLKTQLVVIPSTVDYDGQSYTVTTLLTNTDFSIWPTSVDIPEAVISIEQNAFSVFQTINDEGFVITVLSDSTVAIGAFDFERTKSVIPASVVISGRTFTVTEIRGFAAPKLTSVSIPASVTVIGNAAFYDCPELSSITISSSVTTIGYSAFQGTGLTTVTIPESVTRIEESAFYDCPALTEITYNAINATMSPYWITGDGSSLHTVLTQIKIGSDVQVLPDYFVSRCAKVQSVVIPASVKSIGRHAFSQTGLSSVTIPSPLTSMGDSAFYKCVNLVKFSCLNSIETTGVSVLKGATSLITILAPADIFNNKFEQSAKVEHVTITGGELSRSSLDIFRSFSRSIISLDLDKATNTVLHDSVLYNCYKLDKLILPASLETIENNAFGECSMLKTMIIPASVITIGDGAFAKCHRIDKLTFGSASVASSSLQTIGNKAFYDCFNLKSIVIPESVTEIGAEAFYGCSYLEKLKLPSTLLKLGSNSFALCHSLKSITVMADQPPLIRGNTFYDVNRKIPVFVPDLVQNLYINDMYWGEFFSITAVSNAPVTSAGFVGTTNKPYRISVENNILTIENPTDLPVSIYDIQGRLVGTSTPFTLSNNVFIIKIGNYTETIR